MRDSEAIPDIARSKFRNSMSFRQTYKGIFQFKDQVTLERAMEEIQAEASGADSMGLQDTFHSEGVMLIDIDALASAQDWDEMAVALATLAMHASYGFAYAVAFERDNGGKSTVEYYEGSTGLKRELPVNTNSIPDLADDYFPFVVGAKYSYQGKGLRHESFSYSIGMLEVKDREYFFLEDLESGGTHYSEALDSAYFFKDNSHIFTVRAGNERDLHKEEADDRRAFQLIYNNQSEVGDVLYAIWKDGDYFVVYTRLPNEDVEVPAGSFKDCMKIQVETYHVEEENMSHELQYQYFAKGIGLLKYTKGEASLELTACNVGQ